MEQKAKFSMSLKPRLLEERPGTGIIAAEWYLIYHVDVAFAYGVAAGIPATDGSILVMVRSDISYFQPLRVGEELTIWARTTRLGRSSWTVEYQFTETVSGRPIATILQTYANIDLGAGKSVPLHDDFKQRIIDYEGRDNVEVA
ncbi:MAG: acyl-CoA thioesterase [Chloroflexota bacterium]|nr:acyl-CoA thioesterase [Chloroflexota bacterium]